MDLAALAGTYPILDGEKAAGSLEVSPRGGYLRFRASCRVPERALWRLAARGGAGEADLGALAPEGGLWRLDRRFSPAELRAMGLERIEECRLRRPSPAGWTPEPEPGRLLEEGPLRRLCASVRGALTRRGEEGLLLALPLMETEPFPLMPVFCLGTFRRLEGKPYLVFGIFEGRPGMISPSEGHARNGKNQNR